MTYMHRLYILFSIFLICSPVSGNTIHNAYFSISLDDNWKIRKDTTSQVPGSMQCTLNLPATPHKMDAFAEVAILDSSDIPDIHAKSTIQKYRDEAAEAGNLLFDSYAEIDMSGLNALVIRYLIPNAEPGKTRLIHRYYVPTENEFGFRITVTSPEEDMALSDAYSNFFNGLTLKKDLAKPAVKTKTNKPVKSPQQRTQDLITSARSEAPILLLVNYALREDHFPADYPQEGAKMVTGVAAQDLQSFGKMIQEQFKNITLTPEEPRFTTASDLDAAIILVRASAGSSFEITWIKTKDDRWAYLGHELKK